MPQETLTMTRIRDLGIVPGNLAPGEYNTITDVPGVRVGHHTLIDGDAIRTGVTAIWPHDRDPFIYKTPAAVHTINGFGKAVGFEQVRELGVIETPILLANTLSVWAVADALASYMMSQHPHIWSINPVVGETNDGFLNDIRARAITAAHVDAALTTAADGPVIEGCVGAGTGTSCYQFKGGIGTASRRITDEFTLGALVQTNFGRREELTIQGVRVGAAINDLMPEKPDAQPSGAGSIMVILATDAPLTSRQLGRVARRATFGIARTGTSGHGGSGDFVLAFSNATDRAATPHQVAQPLEWIPDETPIMDTIFQAAVEAVEESIYNALIAATTMTGRKGYALYALPHNRLVALMG